MIGWKFSLVLGSLVALGSCAFAEQGGTVFPWYGKLCFCLATSYILWFGLNADIFNLKRDGSEE